jgi:uncharacterized protein (TIGR04255 family)
MTDMHKPRPSYDNPPVVEVALSVQFEPVKALRTPQLGLLWQEFIARFPLIEEHPPLEPVIERFGGLPRAGRGTVQFQMLDTPPVPRCWFLNNEGTELIQVQPDRFIHNWRKKTGDEEYPRYERLREIFSSELTVFCRFLDTQGLGQLCPNQCEVTYVNHIISGKGWQELGELGAVVTVFDPRYSDSFLSQPEDARLAVRFVIRDDKGEPLGRLHVVAEPAYRTSDGHPMYVLNLTARGRPEGEGIEGVLAFLDIGREWVVRGFTAITTPEMHRVWRRQDAR